MGCSAGVPASDLEPSLSREFETARKQGRDVPTQNVAPDCKKAGTIYEKGTERDFECLIRSGTSTFVGLDNLEWNYRVRVDEEGCWRARLKTDDVIPLSRSERRFRHPIQTLRGCT